VNRRTPLEASLSIAHFTLADAGGGAAGAVFRLHHELLRQHVSSHLYVGRKTSADPHTRDLSEKCLLGKRAMALSRRLDLLPRLLRHPRANDFWSPGWHSLRDVTTMPGVIDADVLCFYWVPRGFLGIAQIGRLLTLGKPCVWRLSDMWPFTGGCHYSGSCMGFEQGCGHCPQLRSRQKHDLSSTLFASKEEHWRAGRLTVVSPSRWMADAARVSPILKGRDIRVIATGVDTTIFQPFDRAQARREWGLPEDRRLVLFGADAALRDRRKGGSSVLMVMQQLAAQRNPTEIALVLFGTDEVPEGVPDGIPVYVMGTISDEARLARLYAACDVFLAPSAQENLANTVLEAMACGTPVIAYALGGMVEAIEHGGTGFLVAPGDEASLAQATAALLADDMTRHRFEVESRSRALTSFDLRTQTAKYIALYRELAEARSGTANETA
jgi:glycosyltransferase involved in cell wall biosynthesis